jgi:hypothetical protein
MASEVSIRMVFLKEKRKVGGLLIVDGQLHRITRGPTGEKRPWTHLATMASEEEKAVWDIMES